MKLKAALTVYFALLVGSVALAQLNISSPFFNAGVLVPAAGGGGYNAPATAYFTETFDDVTDYDDANWTEITPGETDPNHSTTVGEGTESFEVAYSSGVLSYSYNNNFTSTNTLKCEFMYYVGSTPSANGDYLFSFWDSGTTIRCGVELNTSRQLIVHHGTANATTTDSLSEGTWYRVRVEYTAGSGSDGTGTVEFISENENFTGSGNKYAVTTAGTSTQNINYIAVGHTLGFSSGGATWYYDELYVHNE